MPKNDDVKKLVRFWTSFGVMNQIRRVKYVMLKLMVLSPSFSDSCKNVFQKTLHQNPPSSWAIRQWCKKVRSTGSFKRQNESERKSISDRYPTIVQQVVQEQVNTLVESLDNGYASWSCWIIIGCWSEMLLLSLSFCLLTDPMLQAFLYHCRMTHYDGGLWCNVFWKVCMRESEINGNRTNDSIESFTRLWTNS